MRAVAREVENYGKTYFLGPGDRIFFVLRQQTNGRGIAHSELGRTVVLEEQITRVTASRLKTVERT